MWAAAHVGGKWDDRQDVYAMSSCGPRISTGAVALSCVPPKVALKITPNLVAVLVCSGCHDKDHRLGGLKNSDVLSHSLEARVQDQSASGPCSLRRL